MSLRFISFHARVPSCSVPHSRPSSLVSSSRVSVRVAVAVAVAAVVSAVAAVVAAAVAVSLVDVLALDVRVLVVVLRDPPVVIRVLALSEHLREVHVVRDDDELEVLLVPPRVHDVHQGPAPWKTIGQRLGRSVSGPSRTK